MADQGPHRVAIVGAGRLGRSAAALLAAAGVEARLLGRGASSDGATVVWLTVPDRVIAEAAADHQSAPVLLHASGATDLGPLGDHRHAGSLHPLMSFPGPELGLPVGPVPAAVAGRGDAPAVAQALAERMGWTPFSMNGDRRLYHAAAVMAGNFSAALLYAGGQLLTEAGVPPELARGLLLPLVLQGLGNAAVAPASAALTGPVARGDHAVMDAHRAALAERAPELLPVYAALCALSAALLRDLAHERDAAGPAGG